MKKKIYLLLPALCCFMFLACENEPPPESQISYFPKFTLAGASTVVLDCETTSFTDPGISAESAGENVDITTNFEGSYFGAETLDGPDIYSITYTAYNSDGIPNSAFRTVLNPPCSGDLTTDISGLYSSTVVRNGSSGAQYTDMNYILIKSIGGNQYALSDAIGGYYDYGRAYGTDYAALGMTITANDIPSNDFSFGDDIPVGAFGGVLTMESMTVNPGSKTITFVSDWDAGYNFVVTLKQVN